MTDDADRIKHCTLMEIYVDGTRCRKVWWDVVKEDVQSAG